MEEVANWEAGQKGGDRSKNDESTSVGTGASVNVRWADTGEEPFTATLLRQQVPPIVVSFELEEKKGKCTHK